MNSAFHLVKFGVRAFKGNRRKQFFRGTLRRDLLQGQKRAPQRALVGCVRRADRWLASIGRAFKGDPELS